MSETTRTTTGTTDPAGAPAPAVTGERADLLDALDTHRGLLRLTVRDLTDEQAGLRPTVSELCLGGLIKHVAATERGWVDFILKGPSAMPDFSAMTEADFAERVNGFRMLPGETLAGVLADYAEVARRTDELVAALPDLDVSHPLPAAPWFEGDVRWSARRVLLHIVAETAQHAGHADIIRESLDGAVAFELVAKERGEEWGEEWG
ncbi:DinB family protein [Kitasatospora sp. NPDC054939]